MKLSGHGQIVLQQDFIYGNRKRLTSFQDFSDPDIPFQSSKSLEVALAEV
jgi:hypothetical protein